MIKLTFLAHRYRRGPDKGMFDLRPTHSWTFLAILFTLVDTCRPPHPSDGAPSFSFSFVQDLLITLHLDGRLLLISSACHL